MSELRDAASGAFVLLQVVTPAWPFPLELFPNWRLR